MDNQQNYLNITIDWTRHAESCSNMDAGNITDIKPNDYDANTNIGYDVITNNRSYPEKSINITATKAKSSWKYQPNLSFIGMQHAIALGTEYIKKENKRYDMVFVSPTVRTIMTAMLALRSTPNAQIFVVPFIVEKQNIASYVGSDYQNTPVESQRLKRLVTFIKDWMEREWLRNYDDIEVITKLIDLKRILESVVYHDIDNRKRAGRIIGRIDSILSCKPNIKNIHNPQNIPDAYTIKNASTIHDDKSREHNRNSYVECAENIIRRLDGITAELNPEKYADFINVFSDNNKFDNNFENNFDEFATHIDIDDSESNYAKITEIYAFIKNILDNSAFFRGPPVNFTILDELEKSIGVTSPEWINFENFYKIILPHVFKNGFFAKKKSNYNILCVSHGAELRDYFTHKYNGEKMSHMENTQIFGESIQYNPYENNTVPRTIDFRKYIPKRIRSTYKNFEILNMDVCRTESVKGVINYPLWEANTDRKMISNYAAGISTLYYPVDYANPDVKFALPSKYTPVENPANQGYLSYFGAYVANPISNASEKDFPAYYGPRTEGAIMKGGSIYNNLYMQNKKNYNSIKRA